jgi:hypothetical protein
MPVKLHAFASRREVNVAHVRCDEAALGKIIEAGVVIWSASDAQMFPADNPVRIAP